MLGLLQQGLNSMPVTRDFLEFSTNHALKFDPNPIKCNQFKYWLYCNNENDNIA